MASGLVLNFVPDAVAAVDEMSRVLVPGGVAMAYVWDYADGMQMLRRFWDAAIAEDSAAEELDEGPRFPICRPGGLERCFADAGMTDLVAWPLVDRHGLSRLRRLLAPVPRGPGTGRRLLHLAVT